MWIAPESTSSLEEELFRFLTSVAKGAPRATHLLLAENATLQKIYTNPHALLERALHHCVDSLLVEISLDPRAWTKVKTPSWMLGVALALNNCLVKSVSPQADAGFTSALIESLPPSRTPAEVLTNHALFHVALDLRARKPRPLTSNLHALIERSPLSTLWFLHEHTPSSLIGLAQKLLPGFVPEIVVKNVWEDDQDWLNTISRLLDNQNIARVVRQRWLILPETRRACRNIGLVLEALRQAGINREFSLEFYEAYDYFRSELKNDPWAGKVRVWPLMQTIEKLLRVAGDSDAAVKMNRRGNEYFLKFRPLTEIIVAEDGVPKDYDLLTLGFAQSIKQLLPYITEQAPPLSFREIDFNGE